MRFVTWAALLLGGVCGCSAAPIPKATLPSAAPASSAAAATAEPSVGALKFSPFPEAARAFAEAHLTGAMALFDSRDGKLACSDATRCERGYVPASTFKIANTIIALETGVVIDAESPLPWDGKDYSEWNPQWNQDHTLRSAVQVSCVPCFRRIARQVGAARMQDWVTRLNYGNRDISGPIDFFWLGGGLRITALQQVDFLRRLDGAKLPIQEHTLDVVRDVLTLDVGPDHVLRGKTGFSGPPEQPSEVGWFVGFVELGERRVFFATVIDGHGPAVDLLPIRRGITERVLRELGDLP